MEEVVLKKMENIYIYIRRISENGRQILELLKAKKMFCKEVFFSCWCLLVACVYGFPSETIASSQAAPVCSSDSLADISNDLGFKLLQHIGGTDNFFISPFSISTALAMTYLGAGGHTAEQMETVFNLGRHGLNSTQFHQSFGQLLTAVGSNTDAYALFLANSIFVQQNFSVEEEYVNNLNQIYHAILKLVNFAGNGQNALTEINNWVSEKTQNKIQKLISEPLDPTTRLVLLNAVYFKGTWKVQFPKERTTDGLFYLNGGASKRVEMMHLHEEKFKFLEDSVTEYKFVDLPYKGGHIVMLLALPINYESPADLEMTSAILCRVRSSMKETKLEDVIIPKFRMDHKVEMSEHLRGLGIKDLFISGVANLTGIRKANDLFVSEVLHKAVIDVNEEGSEAVAVSGVVISLMSIQFKPTFVANHPFLFYIIDNRNGLILFSGRVANP